MESKAQKYNDENEGLNMTTSLEDLASYSDFPFIDESNDPYLPDKNDNSDDADGKGFIVKDDLQTPIVLTEGATSQLASSEESLTDPLLNNHKNEENDESVDAQGFFSNFEICSKSKGKLKVLDMTAPRSSLGSTVTEKYSPFYDISQGQKLAIVFNHEEFKNNRLQERKGTNKDCESIKKSLGKVGFKTEFYHDMPFKCIKDILKSIQAKRKEELACLFLFFLTHGEENGILEAYDKEYKIEEDVVSLLRPNECPKLTGKPKLIFIQACQGTKTDAGAKVAQKSKIVTDGLQKEKFKIPHPADLLIFQATYFGHFAFRSTVGSWFIQAFCQELDKSGRTDSLHEIILRTKREVALNKESNNSKKPEIHQKVQMPVVTDTLMRNIYFKHSPNLAENIMKEVTEESVVKSTIEQTKTFNSAEASKTKATQTNDIKNSCCTIT